MCPSFFVFDFQVCLGKQRGETEMVELKYEKKIREMKEKINSLIENNIHDSSEKPTNILLDENEAAKVLLISKRKMQTLRYNKKGPQYYKIGSSITYKYEDLLEFLNTVKRK